MKELVHKIAVAIDELGSDHNMRRDRPYLGQPHTDHGIRGMTEPIEAAKAYNAAAVEHFGEFAKLNNIQ